MKRNKNITELPYLKASTIRVLTNDEIATTHLKHAIIIPVHNSMFEKVIVYEVIVDQMLTTLKVLSNENNKLKRRLKDDK